jgi:5-methylcytosine-specific restriction endonuclease McrA
VPIVWPGSYRGEVYRRNRNLRKKRIAAARAKGTHSRDQWDQLKAEFGQRCVRCGGVPDALCKDHIIPIYQGGSDAIENIQPVCRRCNSSKGPEDTNWAAWRRLHGWD